MTTEPGPGSHHLLDRAVARRVQAAEELAASTARALSGTDGLRFRGHLLSDGKRPGGALAAHLRVDAGYDDDACVRGASDGVALQILHSDPALHAERRPVDAVARYVYDLLEQCRVESLAPQSQPGVLANLRHRFRHWIVAAHDGGLTRTSSGLLLHTVAEVVRFRVNGDPTPPETERVTEAPRYALAPVIGHEVAALRRHRHDQRRYADHAVALAERVAELVGGEPGSERAPRSRGERVLAALLGHADGDGVAGADDAGAARVEPGTRAIYRVFTTAHDRERRAGALVRRELLQEYRHGLDHILTEQVVNRRRLARDLEAELTSPIADGWEHGLEAGRVDGRRLGTLVASPDERRVFREPGRTPGADAHVTLLLDCSGSMKKHIEFSAVLVDVLGRALDEIEVPCAVLGFTTSSWNGGRARREWNRARCPDAPGRLAERLHLVFKDDEQPWRRSRLDIAALFKTDMYREGLDGEAVDWAIERTAGVDQRRRIVLVLSDGGPAESATAMANTESFLDRHLTEVVDGAGRRGCEVYGLGLGQDLSVFYPRSTILAASARPTPAAFQEIVAVLRPGPQGNRIGAGPVVAGPEG